MIRTVRLLLCLAAFVAAAACGGVNTNAAAPPTGAHQPRSAEFAAMSVSAISGTQVFVLGTTGCGAPRCVRLLQTRDGFAHTNYLPNDLPAGVSVIRFTSPRDGFAYAGLNPNSGPRAHVIWATQDGGHSWTPVPVGGAPVSLVTAGARVFVVTCSGAEPNCLTASNLLTGDVTGRLRSVTALGALPYSVSVVVHASTVRIVTRAGLLGSDGGGPYTLRPAPCGSTQVAKTVNPAHYLDTVTADATGRLFASCLGGVAAGSQTKVLVSSDNGGATWVQSPTPPPFGGDGAELATAGPGQLILAASSGASWLYRSVDGGRTWTTSHTTNNQLGFADAQHGFAIDESESPAIPNTGTLLRTVDAGAHWSRVTVPSSS